MRAFSTIETYSGSGCMYRSLDWTYAIAFSVGDHIAREKEGGNEGGWSRMRRECAEVGLVINNWREAKLR